MDQTRARNTPGRAGWPKWPAMDRPGGAPVFQPNLARDRPRPRIPVQGRMNPATPGQIASHPSAPPVYRPALLPPRPAAPLNAVQRTATFKPGAAPPVYRPNAAGDPRPGIQGRMNPAAAGQIATRPGAPPVYRPALLPPRPAAPLNAVQRTATFKPVAALVYRPLSRAAAPVEQTHAAASGMFQSPAVGHSRPKSGVVIQPLMGMEIELPTSVLDQGKRIPGHTELMRGQHYKVVADKSARAGTLPDGDSASNIEVVMEPIDEHQYRARMVLNERLEAIRLFVTTLQQQTHIYTQPLTVQHLAALLRLRVANYSQADINAPTTRPSAANVRDIGMIHLTVGVDLAKFDKMINWHAKVHAQNAGLAQNTTTAGQISAETAQLGSLLDADLRLHSKTYRGLADSVRGKLLGFCKLVYTQAAAIVRQQLSNGQIKNFAGALSKVDLRTVRESLPNEALVVLDKYAEIIVKKINQTVLASTGRDPSTVSASGGSATTDFYVKSAFIMKETVTEPYKKNKTRTKTIAVPRFSQRTVFGEMTTLSPEPVGMQERPTTGIPLELRMGSQVRLGPAQWEALAQQMFDASRQWHGSEYDTIDEVNPQWLDYMEARRAAVSAAGEF